MKINEIRLKELIRLLASEWCDCGSELLYAGVGEELPNIPTVYLIVGENNRVQYVGQTKHLRTRMAQHTANPKFMSKVDWDRTFWFTPGVKNVSKRLQVEAVLVAAALPPLNRALLLTRTRFGTLAEIKYGRKTTNNASGEPKIRLKGKK